MAVGVTAMLVSITMGTLVGAIAGFFGELADTVMMRLTDLFLALPQLPLLLLVVYLFRDPLKADFGPIVGIFILVVAVIGGLNWIPVARLVRASFLSTREKEFIQASRALGASDRRIIVLHILPNVISPIVVAATLLVGAAIVTEFGAFLPRPRVSARSSDVGTVALRSQSYLDIAPYWAIFRD